MTCDNIEPVRKIFQLRIALAAASMILLTSAYYRTQTVPIMVDAAKAFLSSLTPEQQARAEFQFDNTEERQNWHFIPRDAKGFR